MCACLKLHITTQQSGPVIVVIICYSHMSVRCVFCVFPYARFMTSYDSLSPAQEYVTLATMGTLSPGEADPAPNTFRQTDVGRDRRQR